MKSKNKWEKSEIQVQVKVTEIEDHFKQSTPHECIMIIIIRWMNKC